MTLTSDQVLQFIQEYYRTAQRYPTRKHIASYLCLQDGNEITRIFKILELQGLIEKTRDGQILKAVPKTPVQYTYGTF